MQIFLNFILLLVSSIILFKSAGVLITTSIKLAKKFHISDFNIGFFVLGIATSTPEIFVGLNSAIIGKPELSLGNLLGASIVLLTLCIGLNAIFSGEVSFLNSFTTKDFLLTSFVIISPGLLLLDKELSRFDGIFLIFLYAIFYFLMNREETFSEQVSRYLEKGNNHVLKNLVWILLGVAGLFIGARILVESAKTIAINLNLPLVLIGLIFISLGTNLPELTVLFESILKHHKQLSMGDFFGSAVANTAILGMVALIAPIQVAAPVKVYFSLAMLALALIMFLAFFFIDKKIHRMEGIALVGLYSFFVFSELFIQNNF